MVVGWGGEEFLVTIPRGAPEPHSGVPVKRARLKCLSGAPPAPAALRLSAPVGLRLWFTSVKMTSPVFGGNHAMEPRKGGGNLPFSFALALVFVLIPIFVHFFSELDTLTHRIEQASLQLVDSS